MVFYTIQWVDGHNLFLSMDSMNLVHVFEEEEEEFPEVEEKIHHQDKQLHDKMDEDKDGEVKEEYKEKEDKEK